MRLLLLVLLAFVVPACRAGAPDRSPARAPARTPVAEPADPATLLMGGTVYTDAMLPPVEALLVQGGAVVAAGAEHEVRARASALGIGELVELDLAGATAVPGLQDAHGHVASLGGTLETVDLVGCASYEEVVRRVAARAAETEPGSWITGRGWDQSLWVEDAFPTHGPLSRAVPEHPVLLRRVDGHAALANALAMERAGLLGAYPVPEVEGGRVEVDAEGRPTGLLVDTAMGLVARHVPAEGRETVRRRILLAQERLLAEGLVCVHDMGIDPETAELLIELAEAGELRLRVIAYLWANDGLAPGVAERFPRAEDLGPAARVRVLGAKLMMDGALGSRGAALIEGYADAPGEHGLLRMEPSAFARRLGEVVDAGLQPATHAIGDRANREVLNAYAARLAQDPAFRALRPRLEHAQIVAPEDWARLDALGVVASMQPTHATTDMRWAEDRLGPARLRGAYAWRRLARPVEHLAFGSDFPVELPSPLLGLYAARTRQDAGGEPPGGWLPDQRLDGAEALAAFTSGAARAAREEARRGRLAPGCFADVTVLSVDPVRCPPEELLTAEVRLTMIEGEVVFAGP